MLASAGGGGGWRARRTRRFGELPPNSSKGVRLPSCVPRNTRRYSLRLTQDQVVRSAAPVALPHPGRMWGRTESALQCGLSATTAAAVAGIATQIRPHVLLLSRPAYSPDRYVVASSSFSEIVSAAGRPSSPRRPATGRVRVGPAGRAASYWRHHASSSVWPFRIAAMSNSPSAVKARLTVLGGPFKQFVERWFETAEKFTLDPDLRDQFNTVAGDPAVVDGLQASLDGGRDELRNLAKRRLVLFCIYAPAFLGTYVWAFLSFPVTYGDSWGEFALAVTCMVVVWLGVVFVGRWLAGQSSQLVVHSALLSAIRKCNEVLDDARNYQLRADLAGQLHYASAEFGRAFHNFPGQATHVYTKLWRARAEAGSKALFSNVSLVLSDPPVLAQLRDDLVRAMLRVEAGDWVSVRDLGNPDFDETVTMSIWRRLRPANLATVAAGVLTVVAAGLKLLQEVAS
jgi:hypothetical protein